MQKHIGVLFVRPFSLTVSMCFLSFKKKKKRTNFYFSKLNIWWLPGTKLRDLLPKKKIFSKPSFLSWCLFYFFFVNHFFLCIFMQKTICIIFYAMVITACLESFIQNETVSCSKSFLLSKNVVDFCLYLRHISVVGKLGVSWKRSVPFDNRMRDSL